MPDDSKGPKRLTREEILRRYQAKMTGRVSDRSAAINPGKRHRHDERAAHFRLRSARKS